MKRNIFRPAWSNQAEVVEVGMAMKRNGYPTAAIAALLLVILAGMAFGQTPSNRPAAPPPGPLQATLRSPSGQVGVSGSAILDCHRYPGSVTVKVMGLAPGSILSVWLLNPSSAGGYSRIQLGNYSRPFRVGSDRGATWTSRIDFCPSMNTELWIEVQRHPDGNTAGRGIAVLRGRLIGTQLNPPAR